MRRNVRSFDGIPLPNEVSYDYSRSTRGGLRAHREAPVDTKNRRKKKSSEEWNLYGDFDAIHEFMEHVARLYRVLIAHRPILT